MNILLHGHNPLEYVVAVHQVNDTTVRVYRRENGKISQSDAEFFPFMFIASEHYLEGYPKKHWIKKLEGNNYYQYLAVFPRWSDLWDAVRHALRTYNKSAQKRIDNYTEAEFILLRADPVSQYLMQSGITYFKNMAFNDVHRFQLDIETYSKEYKFSNPRKTEDRIILITVSDNRGWEEIIDGKKLGEQEMLTKLVFLILEKDPDVIEGHNIFGFDLPYILKRCELHGVEFAIGRDGSNPRTITARPASSDQDSAILAYDVNGRNFVDTLLLVQTYDFSARTLESFGLKYLAQHFGFASEKRVYIPGNKISWHWDNDSAKLRDYALDDIRETRMLSEHLSPSYFYLAQVCGLPYSFLSRSGSTAKIESLLLREYLRQKHSVPKPTPGVQTTGGYSDIFVTGVLSDIIHADVESLYPSIIVSKSITPRYDELKIFPTLLKDLLTMRLEAKRAMREAREPLSRSKFDALQSSYKILINSFYGYLGYNRGLFSDFEQADVVTTTGQALLRHIMKQVEVYNGTVIEVDTDGLYFVPPDNVKGEQQETAFVTRLSNSLPEGITLAYSGRYSKMLSYKKKNYALLDNADRITIKGSSLTARSLERFIRQYLRQCIECLLHENLAGLHSLYVSYVNEIRNHGIDVYDFCRTENLRDPIEVYTAEIAAGKRKPAAAYEVVKRAGIPVRQGESISYYVTGSHPGVKLIDNSKPAEEWDRNFPDENVGYYLSRLDDASEKFEVFFVPEDFKKIFSVDDLFGFSHQGISILRRVVEPERLTTSETNDDEKDGFGIWLDNPDNEKTSE
ncbi:MAG: DNA polymerase [Ignavibacteriae bacterium]|nr:DNA polymerase [Ignavibacteriota bacterium]